MKKHIQNCDAYKENSIFYTIFIENPINQIGTQDLLNLKNELFIYIEMVDQEVFQRSNNVMKDKSLIF
jgi:hypothetical protein